LPKAHAMQRCSQAIPHSHNSYPNNLAFARAVASCLPARQRSVMSHVCCQKSLPASAPQNACTQLTHYPPTGRGRRHGDRTSHLHREERTRGQVLTAKTPKAKLPHRILHARSTTSLRRTICTFAKAERVSTNHTISISHSSSVLPPGGTASRVLRWAPCSSRRIKEKHR